MMGAQSALLLESTFLNRPQGACAMRVVLLGACTVLSLGIAEVMAFIQPSVGSFPESAKTRLLGMALSRKRLLLDCFGY